MSNVQAENFSDQDDWDWNFVKSVLEFLSPIFYAFFWLLLLYLASLWIPDQVILNDQFIPLFTIVYLFALIAKSTLWTIGHEKFGIKGDSRSRIVSYHRGESGEKSVWFDLYGDNPKSLENETTKNLIKELKNIT